MGAFGFRCKVSWKSHRIHSDSIFGPLAEALCVDVYAGAPIHIASEWYEQNENIGSQQKKKKSTLRSNELIWRVAAPKGLFHIICTWEFATIVYITLRFWYYERC